MELKPIDLKSKWIQAVEKKKRQWVGEPENSKEWLKMIKYHRNS